MEGREEGRGDKSTRRLGVVDVFVILIDDSQVFTYFDVCQFIELQRVVT